MTAPDEEAAIGAAIKLLADEIESGSSIPMNDGNYTCRHCCAKLLLAKNELKIGADKQASDRAMCPNCGEPLQPRDGKCCNTRWYNRSRIVM